MRLTSWLDSVMGNLSRKRGGRDGVNGALCLPCPGRPNSCSPGRCSRPSRLIPGPIQLDITLDGSDDVDVQVVNDLVEVSINDTQTGPTPNTYEVFFITVTGGDGANHIDLSALDAADFNYLLMSTYITGGGGDDIILGSGVMDDIFGEGDNDYIEGGDGFDNIWGGEHDDILWSGAGVPGDAFSLDGECGLDTIDGVVDEFDECGGGGPGEPVVVSILATRPTTHEPGFTGPIQPAEFTVTRAGPTTDSLTVHFSNHTLNTATIGHDYKHIESTVVIPSGSSSATIDIEAYPDNDASEGNEAVQLTVTPGIGYISSSLNGTASIHILDYNRAPLAEDQTLTIARDNSAFIATVLATDPDTGQTLSYSIVSETRPASYSGPTFSISANTG